MCVCVCVCVCVHFYFLKNLDYIIIDDVCVLKRQLYNYLKANMFERNLHFNS